jgi:FKBP-type peptidyl-prolyl cis-trans isomerase
MRRIFVHIAVPLLITLFVLPASAQQEAAEEQKLKTPTDELSYVLGMDVGNNLKRFGTEIDLDILLDGVKATLHGGKTLVTPERATEIKKDFLLKRREQMAAERKAAGEKNLVDGKAFLAENKTKEGVITTESGLQYQVIKEGDGPKPKDTDRVTVHYRGTLLDGTEFDSSHKRGKPVTFLVKGVIRGWTEALQLMPVGSTYKLFIPSDLAYGARGMGQKIAPNSTLIFEVELLEIAEPKPKQPAGMPQDKPAEKKTNQ